MDYFQADRLRKINRKIPLYQYIYRKINSTSSRFCKKIYRRIYKIVCFWYKCEIPSSVKIGPGLYINHPFCITINPHVVIGKNCNMHKGVTIGQENRGKRKGTPIIGNEVWIGVNATIVGNIKVGDDVLIAPGAYVNCDVPSHSIVIGNPCKIYPSSHATADYINNPV